MGQFRSSLLFVVTLFLAGCLVVEVFDTPAKPMPEEAYWARQGYSLDKVREYMRTTCGFGTQTPEDTIERRRGFEQCMLNAGFVYMRDQYGLKIKGYAPLEQSRCAKGRPYAELPACRSIR